MIIIAGFTLWHDRGTGIMGKMGEHRYGTISDTAPLLHFLIRFIVPYFLSKRLPPIRSHMKSIKRINNQYARYKLYIDTSRFHW